MADDDLREHALDDMARKMGWRRRAEAAESRLAALEAVAQEWRDTAEAIRTRRPRQVTREKLAWEVWELCANEVLDTKEPPMVCDDLNHEAALEERAETELVALREVASRHMRHHEDCAVRDTRRVSQGCTCGHDDLDAALSRLAVAARTAPLGHCAGPLCDGGDGDSCRCLCDACWRTKAADR